MKTEKQEERKTQTGFFEKSDKIGKPLARLLKKTEQITNIGSERGDAAPDFADSQRVIERQGHRRNGPMYQKLQATKTHPRGSRELEQFCNHGRT